MTRFSRWPACVAILAFFALPVVEPCAAQTKAKGAAAPAAAPAKGTAAKGAKSDAKSTAAKMPAAGEPATVEWAAKVLDLRTFPLMEGATIQSDRTLGMLLYEAKGDAKSAFEFQKKELTKRGWKELPGGYSEGTNASGHFTKEGYYLSVSASGSSDPKKTGWSSVALVNHGNVELAKLPTPPGVKPFYSDLSQQTYTTDAKVPETAAACRKLLLAAGWEPYGSDSADPQSPMMLFKWNAMQLMAWVSSAPGNGGKTHLRYSTELLSADLPAPPEIADPDYTDFQKTLRFDAPQDKTDAIITFYQQRLTKQGWKPTTEQPIADDRTKKKFQIFRNSAGELISVDLAMFKDIVRVEVRHQTAAELAVAEAKAKEAAEKEKQRLAKANEKIKVAVTLPAKAAELEKVSERLFEFKLASGSGPETLKYFRDQFVKQGWTEEEGTKLEKNTGSLELKKDENSLDFSYFDTGVTDAEIRVGGSFKLVLEAVPSADKTAAAEPKPAPKKPGLPSLPGVPKLPEGIEIPAEAAELLKGLGDDKPAAAPTKKKTPKVEPKEGEKTETAADGPAKVADFPIPEDATSFEFSKITKTIKLTSPGNAKTVAAFLTEKLKEKGWEQPTTGLVTGTTGILKFSRGDASLTIFIHGNKEGSEVTVTSKGLVWDEVPANKTAAKKPKTDKPAVASTEPAKEDPPAEKPDEPKKEKTASKLVAAKLSAADEKQAGATATIDGATIKLEYGVAFQTGEGKEKKTIVLLCTKPISTDKVVALLNKGEDGGDAAGFEPQLKLRFDADGKLGYLFLYADGLSVNLGGAGEDVVKAEITVKDGRAKGKAAMVKGGALFDKKYTFTAPFDAKFATATAGAADAPADKPAGDGLSGEEHSGLLFPDGTSERSTSGTEFRKSGEAVLAGELTAVVEFYRRELSAKGWKEEAKEAKVGADSAKLSFAGPEGTMSVALAKQEDKVSIKMAARYPEKAKAAGVAPQEGRGRLILGNATDEGAVVVINGSEYKVAAHAGEKNPKDGVSLHVLPGRYICVLKVPGQPEKKEELAIGVGETWGMIVLPEGGHFADQLY